MAAEIQSLLFDAGELKPIPRRRPSRRVPLRELTPAQRKRFLRRKERERKRQARLFDYEIPAQTKRRMKRRRKFIQSLCRRTRFEKLEIFNLPAEVVDEAAEKNPALRKFLSEINSDWRNRAEIVQSGWSKNHEAKANNYPVQPIDLELEPVEVEGMDLGERDGWE